MMADPIPWEPDDEEPECFDSGWSYCWEDDLRWNWGDF